MAKFYDRLTTELQNFIEAQHIFFVASAPNDGRVNLSPKGMDALRVVNESEIAYLDLTGSGNETAAHLLENGRVTIMLCSFTEKPLILRLYGQGEPSVLGMRHGKNIYPYFLRSQALAKSCASK